MPKRNILAFGNYLILLKTCMFCAVRFEFDYFAQDDVYTIDNKAVKRENLHQVLGL